MKLTLFLIWVIACLVMFSIFGWLGIIVLLLGLATEPLWDKLIK